MCSRSKEFIIMELTPSTSFSAKINQMLTGRETYKTDSGCKITMKAGTGNINVDDNGVINISDAQDLRVYDSKNDDKIKVKNSEVMRATVGRGNDFLLLDACNFHDNKLFTSGTIIHSYGNKIGCSNIMINGDFKGHISSQQGAGRAYGDDKNAHKDNILINGNNDGTINVDTHDKVAIKGEEKGRIVNHSIIYC